MKNNRGSYLNGRYGIDRALTKFKQTDHKRVQETQLSLTNRATRLEVSLGYQTIGEVFI